MGSGWIKVTKTCYEMNPRTLTYYILKSATSAFRRIRESIQSDPLEWFKENTNLRT